MGPGRPGMGSSPFGVSVRSFRRDSSVTKHQVKKGTFKRMLRFARPYRWILSGFLILIILDAFIGVVNPLIYREIINNGIILKNKHLIVTFAIVIALLALLDAFLSIIQRFVSATVGEGLIFNMRSLVFSHIQRMPVAFFTRTQTGALVTRLDNDVLGAQQAFTDTLSSVVSNVISVTLVIITMLILSWQITLVSLAILPVFIIPTRRVGRKLGSLAREGYALNAQMNSIMIERFNVLGALLVKLYGRPKQELDGFRDKAGRVRDIGVSQAMYGRFFFVALTLTASLATALVYGWGGILAVNGGLSVGTVVALTAYLNRLYGPLTALSNVQVDIMTSLVSFERVFEVLDLEPMIKESEDATELHDTDIEITLTHVSFSYPSAEQVSLASLESVAILDNIEPKDVLHDVTFTVPKGKLVALVGPSGAGKTTISHLIPRLYDVNEGSITFNGIDIRELTFNSISRIVGVVTQDSHLFHETIKSNLLYAKPDATLGELRDALKRAQILDLIDSLPEGIETMVGDRGYRLSGGEKQRIAIARLLLKEPSVVVLDEATAHLDSESENLVQSALKSALAGRTSVVIAHRLSTVREADIILVVVDGRIVESGSHEDLLKKNGIYSELYKIQFENQQNSVEKI